MDSLTHITLGACIGELALGKKLGKKALFWGALAQSLPDIDTIPALFIPADQAFLLHRGITHSFVFAIAAGFLFAFAFKKLYRTAAVSFSLLALFFCFQFGVHDLLDTCNSYGTGLLEPFSHQRFSINLLYVVDPLFTIGLLIASLYLVLKNNAHKYRKIWALTAIGISCFYLCFAGFNKWLVNRRAVSSFHAEKINDSKYFTTPAPFNCMLWYVVAAAGTGYYTGYSSVWDNTKEPIRYEAHPKNEQLLRKVTDRKVLQNLISFADDYYTVSSADHGLYLNVLRFQQIHGWHKPDAPFAFSYPLDAGRNQATLLQRGRLAGWNMKTFKNYLNRIVGRRDK